MYDKDNEEVIDSKVKVCEVCNDPGNETVSCRMCGINFCDECGYTEKNLCYDCGDGVDEGMQDEADESLVESSGMDEEKL